MALFKKLASAIDTGQKKTTPVFPGGFTGCKFQYLNV
jgi:hypothetical protein